jgi:glycerate dehydrogenase
MQQRAKVVFLDRNAFTAPIQEGAIDIDCDWFNYDDTPVNLVRERIADATIIITNGVALGRQDLEGLTRLRLISACSTGLDHIDLAYCRDHGIKVRSAVNYATASVAEHTFCLLLALRRNLCRYLQDMCARRWQESGQYCLPIHRIGELRGLRLGIIGYGATGQAVARIARGFAMKVIVARRKGKSASDGHRVDFEDVLATCNVITLHCPLNAETKNLLSATEFALMQKQPIIINTARGGLIDEAALVGALKREQISGAGLDVASSEPIRADNPLLELVGDPRFILTPHVGWASREAQQTLYDMAVENVMSYLRCGDTLAERL